MKSQAMKLKPGIDNESFERILNEGWRLFEKKGYRGVTLDDLCLASGFSKPTIYYYFHDKENLFVRVLQYRLQGFHKVIEHPGTLTERLERIAKSILESFQVEPSILMRDREHIKSPDALQEIKNAFHGELFDPLNKLMQRGIESNELKGNNPELLTRIFLGLINSFIGNELQADNDQSSKLLTGYFLKGAANDKNN